MTNVYFAAAQPVAAQSVTAQPVAAPPVTAPPVTAQSVTAPLRSLDIGGDRLQSNPETERFIFSDPLAAYPSANDGELLRHILLGKAPLVRQAIHTLHRLNYVEQILWSPLIQPVGDHLVLVPRPGEVMSLLVRQIRRGEA